MTYRLYNIKLGRALMGIISAAAAKIIMEGSGRGGFYCAIVKMLILNVNFKRANMIYGVFIRPAVVVWTAD